MKYYIVIDLCDDYNGIENEAKLCKMNIIEYFKYSIMTSFNINIQNIKITNIVDKKYIKYDVISNNYDSIKDFIYNFYRDEDHYNLIHEIII